MGDNDPRLGINPGGYPSLMVTRTMRNNMDNTPPSSVNGDDIMGMEEDGIIYLDDMEELQFDEEDMGELYEQEEDVELEPPEDMATLVFDKHVGSVFCCDLHPSGQLAVTGGEDDKAYVWSVTTGEIVMDCTGHKDSVIFVGFCHDGAYLATVDMCGLIKVWKCNLDQSNKDPWVVAFEYEADDLIWGLWHFGTRVLIVGSVSGDVYILKIPSGDTKILQGHNSRAECGKLFQDGTRLVVGYEDGSVKVWDLKVSSVLHQVSTGVSQAHITDIDTHPDNNLIAAISSEGNVIMITSSSGKVVGQMQAEHDLEVVAFSKDPQLGYFALGTLNGAVSIWDPTRQMVRHNCASPETDVGVTKIIWIKDHIVTGCLDGSIRGYDGRSGVKKLTLTGHRSEILDLTYNTPRNLILTTSDDGTARIFKCEIDKNND